VLIAMPWTTASGQNANAVRWTVRHRRSGSRCRSSEVTITAAARSTAIVPSPTQADSYPDVKGTMAEIASMST
jgi:hypothetical protein